MAERRRPRDPPRAEVVGSLLRPISLRNAVEGFYGEGYSAVLADERAKDRSDLLTNRVTGARAIVRFSPENLEDLRATSVCFR